MYVAGFPLTILLFRHWGGFLEGAIGNISISHYQIHNLQGI
jgi:hypothetical protein